MIGSLLSWRHDDGYALASNVTPALWLAGHVPREVMQSAGAIGLRQIDASAQPADAHPGRETPSDKHGRAS